MIRRKKQPENLLQLRPVLKEGLRHSRIDQVNYLIIPRTNFLERLSIRYFKQPAERKIHLDENGSFVVKLLDGEHTVAIIAEKIKAHFGEEAEPVLERLVKFLQILEVQEWIHYR